MSEMLRVLIVEDSEDDARLVLRELRRGGYELVSERVDSEAAMRKALADKRWDLILSDYMIPGFGGMEALGIAKENGLDLPFILVSSKVSEETLVEAMKAGAMDFVMKDRLSRLGPVVKRELADAAARHAIKRAQESEREQFRLAETFFNHSMSCLVILDRNFNFIRVNEAYARACQKEIGDFTGRNHFEMYPSDTQSIFEEVVRTRQPYATFARAFVFPDQPERGTTYWDWTLVPIVDRNGEIEYLVFSLHDVTERKRDEQRLIEAAAQFRGLVEQSIAGIYIIQDDKFAYANPRFAEIRGYGSAAEIIGREPLSLVAEKDRGIVVENICRLLAGEIPSIDYSFTALRKDGSSVEVGTHAALATYDGRPAIIGLLQDISEKKRAEEEIQRFIQRLQSAVLSTVEVATTISEMRDPYTAGHERRVAAIAVAIGTELGFDANRRAGLRIAGQLHDIGKITIPSEILSKPGKLTAIEFQLVQGHAQASYDILKGVEWSWPVAQVALQHHERMDGSGYPQGLKGDTILLEARIMGVADVVEAISSHRPYRPALGVEKALAEIERGRGKTYDAEVADACLRVFREERYQLSP